MRGLIERLRARQQQRNTRSPGDLTSHIIAVEDPLCQEAAAAIERLTAAQPEGSVIVTYSHPGGQIVAVTRQDGDGRVLEVIGESAKPAQDEVSAERERCAKLADEYATWGGSNFAAWFHKLAAAIREDKP